MCTAAEFLEEIKNMTDGFIFAMFTDEIWLEKLPLKDKEKDFEEKEYLLLEARAFNQSSEIKLFRTDIGRDFQMRIRDDSQEYFPEEQYLDIADIHLQENFEVSHMVRAKGGGRYHLPIADYKNAKIKIHNYIDYYKETGQAYICDWRLAGIGQTFDKTGEKENEDKS